MNKFLQEEEVRQELKRLGFKPREDKDINQYIKCLKYRLKKENKDIIMGFNENNKLELKLVDKIPSAIARRYKFLQIRVNDEEIERYNKLAEEKGTTISNLVRSYLDSLSKGE